MHTSTKKWKAPRFKAREEGLRKLRARKYLCPDSPFYTEHFNFQQHETIMLKEKEMWHERFAPVHIPVEPFGGRIFAPSLHEIFDEDYPYGTHSTLEGKFLQTTSSPVLCMPTIWQSKVEKNKHYIYPFDNYIDTAVALYPGIQELKLEGPDRTASFQSHRRFFPAPRHPCNQTVNWSVRPYLKPHSFDAIVESDMLSEEQILTNDWEIGLPDDEDLQVGLPVPVNKVHEVNEIRKVNKDDGNITGMKAAGEEPVDAEAAVEEPAVQKPAIEDDKDPYGGNKAARLLGNDLLSALDPQNVYF
ncbi:hypothetical protein E4T39_07500 [Aureobasidium subglaciale]|nr:hypothetical protein E4T39_07500 [Aureobasidium subglaciale]